MCDKSKIAHVEQKIYPYVFALCRVQDKQLIDVATVGVLSFSMTVLTLLCVLSRVITVIR